MKHSLRWLAFLVAVALLGAACGDDSDEATGGDDATGDEATGGDEASDDPIRIGILTSLTGPFTSWGLHVEAGALLAADDINADGGIGGRMVEVIVVDDQSDPEEGVVQMERLIEDGVVAIAGTISSGVGGATSPLAESSEIPLFFSKAGSDALLTEDSRYTFRTCLPAGPMLAVPWAEYANEQGFTRVGSMIADYGWGQSFLAASESVFGDAGLELQSEVAPVGEQDFSTYLRSITDFEPELLLATGHPPGAGAILAQAADLGIDVNVTGPGSSLTAVMEAAGDTAFGRYADLSCADYFSDSYADLASRYVAETGLGFMEDDAVAMYAVVNIVAEAAGEVGDDPVAIADTVRAGSYDMPGMAYTLSWTEWGELAESTLLLIEMGAGPAPAGLNEAGEWWPEILTQSAPLEPYVPGS